MDKARLRTLVVRALLVVVAAFLAVVRSWSAVAFVAISGAIFQFCTLYRTTTMLLLGGFPHLKEPIPLTQKRGVLLYLIPLPPGVDALWDTWVVGRGERYKVRLVLSSGSWLVQRSESADWTKLPVSTREPIDSQNWTTWYVAEGTWHSTVVPRNVQERASWKAVGQGTKFHGRPLVVMAHGEGIPSRAALSSKAAAPSRPTARRDDRRRR